MIFSTHLVRRPLVLALAGLLAVAGCAGSQDDGAADHAALSAGQVNAARGDFKQHVLQAVPASAKNQQELGIATWDVFAGADAATGFVGTVFYASDAAGDVRYAFAANLATREVSVAVLEKDGTANADPKVDQENLKALMDDVARLRDTVKPTQAAPGAIHTQDLPSERTFACAVTLAYIGLAGVAVGAVVIGAPAVVAGGFASAIMGSTFVAGGLFAGYQVIAAFPEGLADDIGACL